MSKILCIGDLQFHAPKAFDLPDADGNWLLDREEETLRWILQYGVDNGIKDCVFLGDVHGEKDRIQNRVKNRLIDIFNDARKSRNLVVVISGNHDKRGDAIKYLENYADVYNEPEVVKIGGISTALVPHISRGTQLDVEMVEEFLKKADAPRVFGHFFVDGFQPPNSRAVDFKLLSKFGLVLLGHQHLFTEITKRMYYLGSIYQEDFGEAGQGKYIAVVDELRVKFVEVSLFIKRKTYKLNSNSSVDEMLLYFKNNYDIGGNIIRIDTTSAVDTRKIQELKEMLVQRTPYVEVNLLPDEFRSNMMAPVSRIGQDGIMEEFFDGLLRNSEVGEKYFLSRVIQNVRSKVKEER